MYNKSQRWLLTSHSVAVHTACLQNKLHSTKGTLCPTSENIKLECYREKASSKLSPHCALIIWTHRAQTGHLRASRGRSGLIKRRGKDRGRQERAMELKLIRRPRRRTVTAPGKAALSATSSWRRQTSPSEEKETSQQQLPICSEQKKD